MSRLKTVGHPSPVDFLWLHILADPDRALAFQQIGRTPLVQPVFFRDGE